MAFQMNFTDPAGVIHNESYWRVVLCNLSQATMQGEVVFSGYHSFSMRQLGYAPIGSRRYTITQDIYQQFFAPSILSPVGENPVKKAYEMALQTPDARSISRHDTAPTYFFSDAVGV